MGYRVGALGCGVWGVGCGVWGVGVRDYHFGGILMIRVSPWKEGCGIYRARSLGFRVVW
jgi:hypothetical protein